MDTPTKPLTPFDIRTAPIWAIPQLRWLTRQDGFTVVDFYQLYIKDHAWVEVHIENKGVYLGIIKKSRMNNPGPISLAWLVR